MASSVPRAAGRLCASFTAKSLVASAGSDVARSSRDAVCAGGSLRMWSRGGRRALSSLRDAAARAVVSRAIDQITARSGMKDRPASDAKLDPDGEYDALTWKSIVDSPVLVDADSISSADLYPPRAPRIADLVAMAPLSSPHSSSTSSAAASSSSAASAAGMWGAASRSSAPTHSTISSSSSPRPSSASSASSSSSSPQVDESSDHLDLTAFPGAQSIDPFELVSADLRGINGNIKQILGIDHPVLSTVAKYFFDYEGGKKIRPALVLLMAHAVNAHMSAAAGEQYTASGKISLSVSELAAAQELAAAGVATLPDPSVRKPIPSQVALPLQRRLAEITEMIHTASLLHDDVIDAADTRRGMSSVNTVFGNKLAVLAGDFLLARASVCLARLRNVPVVELLSTVIEHLVKGEVMQMKTALRSEAASQAAFELYLRKTYYKTGSLMANSCKAIALLGCYPDEVCNAAYKYGMHLGIAFQLIDDMLDFEGTSQSLGKPALNDITQGLATAPVLLAAHRFPTLIPLIERKFSTPGDVETALKAVTAVDGLGLTRKLAVAHAQVALDNIAMLSASSARTALAALATRVLNRTR